MWGVYISLAVVQAAVVRDEPEELKDIPGSEYKEASTVSYKKFNELDILQGGEDTKLKLFVSSEEPSAILAYEDSQAHCIDEFVGFESINKGKIDSAMTSPEYAFCQNSGTRIAMPNIKVEHNLTCATTGWTRLDCKFTPKDNPQGVFFASRVGRRARIAGLAGKAGMPGVSKAIETGGRALRAITSPITSLFTDDVQTFTDRVSCQKPLQKPQIDECNSLLSAWTTINDAMSPSSKNSTKKKVAAPESAQTKESEEEAGDVQQGEGKKSGAEGDDSSVSSDSNSGYYILGGVGVLIILIVVATQCMGDKKKARDDGEDTRRKSRRNRTEAQSAQDSPEGEKRSHRRK